MTRQFPTLVEPMLTEMHSDGAIEYSDFNGTQIAIARADEDGEYRLTHVAFKPYEWALSARLRSRWATDHLVRTIFIDVNQG